MDLDKLTKEASHCTHGSLTSYFGWIFQIILAFLALACLIVKRFWEPLDQRRSWKIWWFDTTKLYIGCLIVHFINILIAEIDYPGTDPCTLYLISFILDTSIGLLLIYVFIRLVLFIATKLDIQTLNFGFYGEPKIKYWLHQTIAYVIILLVQKTIIIIILNSYKTAWNQISDFLILRLMPNKEVEVVLVILVIPFLTNTFIFWVTDNFLTMSNYRPKKILNFTSSSQAMVKKLSNLKNCIPTSTKLVNIYDIMFINTKQKLKNEEDANLVEINLKEISCEQASNQTI